MTNIYYPSTHNKYKIPISVPIFLRVACSAGVNRSATFREFLKNHISANSIVMPQYGAKYGDYEAKQIINFETNERDGFYDVFGVDKSPSMQSIIFKKIGYAVVPDFTEQHLDMANNEHVEFYKSELLDTFWNVEKDMMSVFVLINESEEVINCVIKRLAGMKCDLVIVREHDCIYEPGNGIVRQSGEAYRVFVSKIGDYFEFTD